MPHPAKPAHPSPTAPTPEATVPAPVAVEGVLFDGLGLAPGVLSAVKEEGYERPTPIQAQAIPHVLAGRDVLGCAQTGTGKTAAFSLPILTRLSAAGPGGAGAAPAAGKARGPARLRALVLSPTRELALQIEESMRTYGRHTGLRTVCVFGGVSQHPQTRALRHGVEIMIATPGRLIDLMDQGHVDLSGVEVFVLDEADRMLDMGFIDPIRRIVSKVPARRQTLLFSATMPGPIRALAATLLKDPVSVQVAPVSSTAERVDQSVILVPFRDKGRVLVDVLKGEHVDRALVFTRTKHGADRVAKNLGHAGIRADAIHGNKRQNQRQRTLEDFRSGRTWVLVATDIAARGIDVEGVSHVVNFDLPNEPETYVHRIGRTARAGASGKAVSLCDPVGEERGYLRAIERLTRRSIPVAEAPPSLSEGPVGWDAPRTGDRPGRDRPDGTRGPRPPRPSAPTPPAPPPHRRGPHADGGHGHAARPGSPRRGTDGRGPAFGPRNDDGRGGHTPRANGPRPGFRPPFTKGGPGPRASAGPAGPGGPVGRGGPAARGPSQGPRPGGRPGLGGQGSGRPPRGGPKGPPGQTGQAGPTGRGRPAGPPAPRGPGPGQTPPSRKPHRKGPPPGRPQGRPPHAG